MATKSKTLAVGTAYAEILAGAVGMEVIAFALQFTNTTAAVRTLTLSHYVQAEGVAVETTTEVAAGASIPWPKLALQPGDGLQLKADAAGVNALVSFDVDDGAAPVAAGLTPRGAYSALADYSVNDFVQDGGSAWVSLVDGNTNHPPASSPAQWMLFASVPQALVDASVAAALAGLLDGAPAALDTLNELAAAIGDDADFAGTVTAALSARALAARTVTGGGLATGGGDLSADRTITVAASTANEVRAGSSTTSAPPPASLTSSAAFEPLTDAPTIAWDTALGYNARVTLSANRIMGEPTNLHDGLTYTLAITQDGTGSRTLSWNAIFDWGQAGIPALSTAASKVDYAFGIYSSTTGKLHMNFRKAA